MKYDEGYSSFWRTIVTAVLVLLAIGVGIGIIAAIIVTAVMHHA